MTNILMIPENEDKIKEILLNMLKETGNTNIAIIKEGNMIKILKREEFKEMVSLSEKLLELEDVLYTSRKGELYKAMMDIIEKPLFEHVLQRTDGNQLKAAKILGINRNTMRTRIRKLEINTFQYK